MKKSFLKPVTAVLIALIIAIVPLSAAFASGGNTLINALTPTDASTNTDAPLNPDTPDIPSDEPAAPSEPSDGDVVGTISIAFRLSHISFGHVWVYITNTTDAPFEVGLYTLQPGEGVSLGNFNLSRSDGSGLYYNVESHCGNKYGTSGTVAVTDKLTYGRLKAVTKALIIGNHFDPIYNCTGFALTIWNIGSSKIIPFIPISLVAMLGIFAWGGKINSLEMTYPPAEQVYKQIGNGGKAYLKPVSEGSLDSEI